MFHGKGPPGGTRRTFAPPERPHVWQAEKIQGMLFLGHTVPSQSVFDCICCDVDGFLQFIFSLGKWLGPGCAF